METLEYSRRFDLEKKHKQNETRTRPLSGEERVNSATRLCSHADAFILSPPPLPHPNDKSTLSH